MISAQSQDHKSNGNTAETRTKIRRRLKRGIKLATSSGLSVSEMLSSINYPIRPNNIASCLSKEEVTDLLAIISREIPIKRKNSKLNRNKRTESCENNKQVCEQPDGTRSQRLPAEEQAKEKQDCITATMVNSKSPEIRNLYNNDERKNDTIEAKTMMVDGALEGTTKCTQNKRSEDNIVLKKIKERYESN